MEKLSPVVRDDERRNGKQYTSYTSYGQELPGVYRDLIEPARAGRALSAERNCGGYREGGCRREKEKCETARATGFSAATRGYLSLPRRNTAVQRCDKSSGHESDCNGSYRKQLLQYVSLSGTVALRSPRVKQFVIPKAREPGQ
jgi:hypothetical protein